MRSGLGRELITGGICDGLTAQTIGLDYNVIEQLEQSMFHFAMPPSANSPVPGNKTARNSEPDTAAKPSPSENPFAEFATNAAFSCKVTGAVAGSTAGKTVATILGEIKLFAERIWLMSQSPKHKAFMIGDLEWLVMPAVLLRQFRIYYEKDIPVGVIIYARVDAATAARLDAGAPTLRPADWQSGQRADGKLKPDGTLRIVEIIAPFGGREEMETEFKGAVRVLRGQDTGLHPILYYGDRIPIAEIDCLTLAPHISRKARTATGFFHCVPEYAGSLRFALIRVCCPNILTPGATLERLFIGKRLVPRQA